MSNTLGINPAPIPCIACDPDFPPERTGLEDGSTAKTLIFGFFRFRNLAQTVIVPPVPTPAINPSILPSQSSQISLAVVCS